jgi:hypothetical protein
MTSFAFQEILGINSVDEVLGEGIRGRNFEDMLSSFPVAGANILV